MFLFANQYELETLLDSQTVNKKAVECILEYTATRTGTFTTGNHNSATHAILRVFVPRDQMRTHDCII